MEMDLETKRTIVTVCLIISLPFFLVNILVYWLIKDLRRSVHGKIFISLQCSMLIGYSLLASINLQPNIEDAPCVILGYTMQFAFLSTFTWMNVMCFDIWWNFRAKKSTNLSEIKKCLFYSIYAWGVPLLILLGTVIVDYTPIVADHHKLKPKIGSTSCFFTRPEAAWLYLYGPMAILILINVVMFVYIAKIVFFNSSTTQNSLTYKERFSVCLKLFIIMGVSWVAELLSWAFEYNNIVFCIADIINSLQGTIIFIIFICKAPVIRLIKNGLCPNRSALEDTINSSCNYYTTKNECYNETTQPYNDCVQMTTPKNTNLTANGETKHLNT